MPYDHIENDHRATFAGEEDYLRCKLLYLESRDRRSFTSFLMSNGYRGREPMRRGRMEVTDIERVPDVVPFFGNVQNHSDLEVPTSGESNPSLGVFATSDGGSNLYASSYDTVYQDRLYLAQVRSRERQAVSSAQQLEELSGRQAQQSQLTSQLQSMFTLGRLPTDATDPPSFSDADFDRDFRAEFSGTAVDVEEDEIPAFKGIEETIKKKPKKKKTVFDIIDID